jgi:hypothetical protein
MANGTRLRTLAAAAAMAAGLIGTVATATPPPLSFETAFDDRNEPTSLHFTAAYLAGQQAHELEFWRRGQTRLRRRTDGFLETFVTRSKAGDPEYQMTVLDRHRRITTRIDRTHLYKVGNFTDWFDLAHGLKHPLQAYTISRISAPAGTAAPIDRCDWYALQSAGTNRLICWSRKYRLPLLIYLNADQAPVWQIKQVSRAAISDAVFAIDDEGFVKNDASQDIEND